VRRGVREGRRTTSVSSCLPRFFRTVILSPFWEPAGQRWAWPAGTVLVCNNEGGIEMRGHHRAGGSNLGPPLRAQAAGACRDSPAGTSRTRSSVGWVIFDSTDDYLQPVLFLRWQATRFASWRTSWWNRSFKLVPQRGAGPYRAHRVRQDRLVDGAMAGHHRVREPEKFGRRDGRFPETENIPPTGRAHTRYLIVLNFISTAAHLSKDRDRGRGRGRVPAL